MPDFNDIDGSLTELKEMQQILRDKYTKKSKDLDEEDYNSKHIDSKIYILFNFTRLICVKYYNNDILSTNLRIYFVYLYIYWVLIKIVFIFRN